MAPALSTSCSDVCCDVLNGDDAMVVGNLTGFITT